VKCCTRVGGCPLNAEALDRQDSSDGDRAMCGIVGYFGPSAIELSGAANSILHRGPDMQGTASGPGWTVGFNRLAILDTTKSGMQPFTFDGVSVVMNGEIYNYRELREQHKAEFVCRSGSDVEIVPFLYKKYGMEFLQKLNGMFAMVIAEAAAGRFFLVRDRYGKKPLFFSAAADGVYFASELKALRRLIELRPDRTNLALNMSCWLMVQPLTPYEGVFNVNPGHYVAFDGRALRERRWYAPRIEGIERQAAEVSDHYLALYRRSVELRLRSDVPVGVSLSGGLDSSSIAYLAQQLAPENFSAFTANIAGKDSWEGDTDTENPRRLCSDLGIRQISTDINCDFWNRNIVDIARNYDEILLNSGTLVFYAISAAARANGVKVLLSGVGGDELFGGYPWQRRMRSLPSRHLLTAMTKQSSNLSKRIHALLSRVSPRRFGSRLARAYRLYSQFQVWHAQSLCSSFVPYMRDVERQVAERIEDYSERYFRLALEAVGDDPYNQIHYANIFTVIGNQNYQVDMASMFHSVENRSPLLDFNLVEYLLSVPDGLKNASGPKSFMRESLAAILPPYITQARKSGPTMPLDLWVGVASGLGTKVRAFIRAHADLIAQWLSPELAGHLHDEELYAGSEGAMRSFALVSFVLWAKLNVDQSIADERISFSELAADYH
jgi:asparagine synthase (glutamine-hydrolysing)